MELIIGIIKDIILICGVFYGVYEYFLFRKNKAKIEDRLEIKLFDLGKNKYLLDIKIWITNKSSVRKYIKKILLSIKTLSDGDIKKSIEDRRMVKFSNKIIKKYRGKDISNNILEEYPKKIKDLDFWIDSNTSQSFHYPIVIETKDEFAQINIEYPMGKSGNKYLSRILKLDLT